MQKSAIRPGSNFNRQGGSIFHQRQHATDLSSIVFDQQSSHLILLSDESKLLIEMTDEGKVLSFCSLARSFCWLAEGHTAG
jgi:uncharacterized protein YjiK